MSKSVKIPESDHPFICEINGVVYKYQEGTTQVVPDEVAELIGDINELAPKEKRLPGLKGQVWTRDEKGYGYWDDLTTNSENPWKIAPLGDGEDDTQNIVDCLEEYGKCELIRGETYIISQLSMPDGTKLYCSDNEKAILLLIDDGSSPSTYGVMLTGGNTLENVSLGYEFTGTGEPGVSTAIQIVPLDDIASSTLVNVDTSTDCPLALMLDNSGGNASGRLIDASGCEFKSPVVDNATGSRYANSVIDTLYVGLDLTTSQIVNFDCGGIDIQDCTVYEIIIAKNTSSSTTFDGCSLSSIRLGNVSGICFVNCKFFGYTDITVADDYVDTAKVNCFTNCMFADDQVTVPTATTIKYANCYEMTSGKEIPVGES